MSTAAPPPTDTPPPDSSTPALAEQPKPQLPLDEVGLGDNWLVLKFLLHAVAGVFSGRVLLLAALGLLASELACAVIAGPGATITVEVPAAGASGGAAGLLESSWRTQAAYGSAFVAPFTTRPESATAAVWQALGGVVRIGVWSVFAVALARIAACHLTDNRRPSASGALGLALRSAAGSAAGPLTVLAAVGLLAGVLWCLGAASQFWLMMIPSAALVILIAPLAAVLAIGLALGTPLMWASQAVERPDPFDAVSCGFAYACQRPLRLLAYASQAVFVATVSGALVLFVAQVASQFALVWLAGHGEPSSGAAPDSSARLLRFATAVFSLAPLVFHAAYFWFAATAVYLLLRRDIDEKPCDEIHNATHDAPQAEA